MTFHSENDRNEKVDFSQKNLTFTLQMIES